MSFRWEGVQEFNAGFDRYEREVNRHLMLVAQFWQGKLEAYMKTEANWVDRTANARQSLHTFIEELAGDTIRLYLSHGVHYGIFLLFNRN